MAVTRSIRFESPAEVMTLNKRYHWAVKMQLTAAWRHAAEIHARNAKLKDVGPSIVKVTFNVTTNRRRDGHNYIATVKPIIDGMVAAGVWPDDTGEWVAVVDPEFNVVGTKSAVKNMVLVEVTER